MKKAVSILQILSGAALIAAGIVGIIEAAHTAHEVRRSRRVIRP